MATAMGGWRCRMEKSMAMAMAIQIRTTSEAKGGRIRQRRRRRRRDSRIFTMDQRCRHRTTVMANAAGRRKRMKDVQDEVGEPQRDPMMMTMLLAKAIAMAMYTWKNQNTRWTATNDSMGLYSWKRGIVVDNKSAMAMAMMMTMAMVMVMTMAMAMAMAMTMRTRMLDGVWLAMAMAMAMHTWKTSISVIGVLKGAVEDVYGPVIKEYPAYKKPLDPSLRNVRFDLNPTAKLKYKKYLEIDLRRFGRVKMEVIGVEMPWCSNCRCHFHKETDDTCPIKKQKMGEENKEEPKGKDEEKGKEKDMSGKGETRDNEGRKGRGDKGRSIRGNKKGLGTSEVRKGADKAKTEKGKSKKKPTYKEVVKGDHRGEKEEDGLDGVVEEGEEERRKRLASEEKEGKEEEKKEGNDKPGDDSEMKEDKREQVKMDKTDGRGRDVIEHWENLRARACTLVVRGHPILTWSPVLGSLSRQSLGPTPSGSATWRGLVGTMPRCRGSGGSGMGMSAAASARGGGPIRRYGIPRYYCKLMIGDEEVVWREISGDKDEVGGYEILRVVRVWVVGYPWVASHGEMEFPSAESIVFREAWEHRVPQIFP
ncbi:hypothetical protein CBR_g23675 [Chara braunii]|uniref:Uncharacterized protein n=1 Tax=Chara braunii TaxID=69332 RepID=A0A388L571_CHABU|nr:hypothetical protein CBR_g23675 [Chara braunii]|eukprot:GBG77343.1 hypothetical protein CBR_g23675 [Chara braunii]